MFLQRTVCGSDTVAFLTPGPTTSALSSSKTGEQQKQENADPVSDIKARGRRDKRKEVWWGALSEHVQRLDMRGPAESEEDCGILGKVDGKRDSVLEKSFFKQTRVNPRVT